MPDPAADTTDDPAGWKALWYSLGVIVVLLGCFYGFFRVMLRHRVDRRIEQLAGKGYATTVDDLRRMYPYPEDGPNAADIYMKAAKKAVDAPDKQEAIMPIVGGGDDPEADKPLSAKVQKAIKQHLDNNKEALKIVLRAADVEEARYPVDLSKGLEMLLPHLSEVRELVRVLGLRVMYLARQKESEKVFESLRAAIALSESLAKEPLLISQLVRIACHKIVIDALEKGMAHHSLGEQHLAILGRKLAAAEDKQILLRALQGETVTTGINVFRQSLPDLMKLVSRRTLPLRIWLYGYSGAQQLDFLVYLDRMEMYMDASREPLQKRLKTSSGVPTTNKLPFYSIVTPMLLPALELAATEECIYIALLRAARMGLAVERYKVDNGHVPDTLQKLVPKYAEAVLNDPFTGKPLKYRSDGNRYVIYSLGANKKDNGGTDEDRKDIVFEVKKIDAASAGDGGDE